MKAYISCPMSEPFSLVQEVEAILKKKGYKTDYWERNKKYNKNMSDYDIFVLIPEDNLFDIGANKFGEIDLSRGCSSEFNDFYDHNYNEMYIAYRNQSRLQIYKFDPKEYKGIPGTNLKSIVEQTPPTTDNNSSKIFDACY